MKYVGPFPHNVKPVRVGVYDVASAFSGRFNLYSYWNGNYWCFTDTDIDLAELNKDNPSNYQNRSWRGISK